VIAKTDQSTITTENLAFDPVTGQPLLTSVIDQYETPVYNISYPAYWYYKNMGPSSLNSNLIAGPIDNASAPAIAITGSSGAIGDSGSSTFIADNIDYFTFGDRLYLQTETSLDDYLVRIVHIGATTIHCIQEDGTNIPSSLNIAAIRMMESGYKNMHPVSAGGTTFKQLVDFSLADQQTLKTISGGRIINASAVEFSDDWPG
jgi:hypothetical protein